MYLRTKYILLLITYITNPKKILYIKSTISNKQCIRMFKLTLIFSYFYIYTNKINKHTILNKICSF